MPGPYSPLGHRLGELLRVEKFPPPAGFAAHAVVTDPVVYEQAAADPAAWWATQARERLHWDTPFSSVLDDSNPPFYTWFADGTINAAYNCLDRHVLAGRGDRVAFHWRGEEGEERDLTYAELLGDVRRLANALKAQGIRKGDIVGIHLPMIPEVVVAMLACARIGAPHAVVSGLPSTAVRERLQASRAKALIVADGARRKGKLIPVKHRMDKVISDLPDLETVVVARSSGADCLMRPGRDVWFDDLVASAGPACPAEPMAAEHPLFLLYSSGPTARPAGIVHTTGGYLAGVTATTAMVFDLDADHDIFWCTADAGRITAHSYVVYGPLANGCTSVLFEGGPDYPDKDIWWEIVERYGVTILYTGSAAIRACMRWGAKYPAQRDLSSLRLLGSAGEPASPEAWVWYHAIIGGERCPIVDTWCQAETGAIMISTLPGLTAAKPGSAGRPLPGVSAALMDESGGEADQDSGVLTLTQPWPSMLRTLHDEPDRYVQTYFAGFGPRTYVSGDCARRDEDGYFWITGRAGEVPQTESGTIMRRFLRDVSDSRQPDDVTTLHAAPAPTRPQQDRERVVGP
jgi:acetyl-CoA synthetase